LGYSFSRTVPESAPRGVAVKASHRTLSAMPPSPEQHADYVRQSDLQRRNSHSTPPVNSEKGDAIQPPSIFELSTEGEYSENSNEAINKFFAPESIIDQFTRIPEASCFDPVGQSIPLKLKKRIWQGNFIDMSLLLKSTREIDEALGGRGQVCLFDGKLRVVNDRPSNFLTIEK
jgi:hypothetical protein